jgi:hypothetical protein
MLTLAQWFLLTMFVAGTIGYLRGWERSLITGTIIVLVTWFLLLGGDVWLSWVLTNWQVLRTMPSTQAIHAVAAPLYGAVFVLAHAAGSHWGRAPGPKKPSLHWAGIVPGAVTGAAFVAYLSHWAAPQLFTHAFTTYFPVLFGIGVLLNLLFLFIVAKSRAITKKTSDTAG